LKPERIQKQLAAHPGWTAGLPKQKLRRQYEFPTFERAVQCANLVAREARGDQHAVALTIDGGSFTLELSSPLDSDLTEAQFALAGVIDEGVQALEGEVAG